MTSRMWHAGLALTLVLASACASRSAADEPPLPGKPAIVNLTIWDDHIAVAPDLPAGRVVFRIQNRGRVAHSLLLFPEDEDAPPLDQQLKGSVRRAIAPLAAVFPRGPGQFGIFAVDLVAGRRYGVMSTARDAKGTPDFLRGLNAEFHVQAT